MFSFGWCEIMSKHLLGEFVRHLLFIGTCCFLSLSSYLCLLCTPPPSFFGLETSKVSSFALLYSGSRLYVEITRYLVDLEVVLSWVTAASILRRRDSWVSEGTRYEYKVSYSSCSENWAGLQALGLSVMCLPPGDIWRLHAKHSCCTPETGY